MFLHLSCRISSICARFCNIFCNDAACTDYNIITDADWHDGGVRTNTHSVADCGLFPLCLVTAGGAANSEGIVDEHRTVTDEAFLSNGYELANECVTLHTGAGTD